MFDNIALALEVCGQPRSVIQHKVERILKRVGLEGLENRLPGALSAGEQQRAAIELRNQREQDREIRLQLEESIRGSVLELENQWTSAQLSQRSNEIAREALALAREEYRLGARSFEELRAVFQQEADTRRQVITARHAFVDALLTLEEAVGASVREASGSTGAGN